MNPKIVVTAFKGTGKFYSDSENELSTEHAALPPWTLSSLIRSNDPSVRHYSGLSSGFNGDFYYVVQVVYPENEHGFNYFLFDNLHGNTPDHR